MKPQSEGSPTGQNVHSINTAEKLATQHNVSRETIKQNAPLRQNDGTGETHRVGEYFRKLNFEPSSQDLISELFILNILLSGDFRPVNFFIKFS